MAIKTIELTEPSREDGQYKSVLVKGLSSLDSLYITAGFNRRGIPRAWTLLHYCVEITTSADVANRQPYLALLDGYQLPLGSVKGKVIAASSAGAWDVGQVTYISSDSGPGNSLGLVGLSSQGWTIQGDGRVNAFFINGKAADVVIHHFLFKWLRPEI